MSSAFKDMFGVAKSIAERLEEEKFKKALVISHIDADGLTAASIASLALQRQGIEYKVKFIKQLDDKVIEELDEHWAKTSANQMLFWFTDLGSGMCKQISKFSPIITDHHAPNVMNYDVPVKSRMDLLEFSDVLEHQLDEYHLNPHLFNLDGTYDVSGAGTAYLVTRELSRKNSDLAYLAVIGAVGDLQDSRFRQLIGTNRKILEDAEAAGMIKTVMDISSFGRETREIQNVLRYSTDPYFPGLTMNEANCIRFLKRLGIPLTIDGRPRHWVELTNAERQTILSELMELMLSKGIGHKDAKRLLGEVYTLPAETIGTVLHDAKEFSTLLNSCGKYNKPEVGFQICLGNRDEQLANALKLLKGHRSVLMSGLQFIKDQGITKLDIIQYFDAEDRIPENIVGTIASMLLNNGDVDEGKPIFGFVQVEDGSALKVSGRTTRTMVNKGVNLSQVMAETSRVLGSGSIGGGHDIAAGATIPLDKKHEFLAEAEKLVKRQITD
ncbi:DHHA1 domain-containing protein [[Eubacterium] cellulosolvens]